jgi:hypothetical protein
MDREPDDERTKALIEGSGARADSWFRKLCADPEFRRDLHRHDDAIRASLGVRKRVPGE